MTQSALLGAALAEPRIASLASLRAGARAALMARGLPGPRDEAWRFTRVRSITDVAFRTSTASELDATLRDRIAEVLPAGAAAVVLVNGRRVEQRGELPAGVEIASIGGSQEWVHATLGRVLREPEGFAALNSAQFSDGIALRFAPNTVVSAPVYIVQITPKSQSPSASYPRVVISAGAKCQATVVEIALTEGAATLTDAVTEVSVEAGAQLEHVRVTQGGADSRSVALLAVEQESDSGYSSRIVTLGGALTRTDVVVRLAGKGAECVLDGLYLAAKGEQVDHHTYIDHVAPHTTSLEKYKGILDGDGSAIFDGIIRVSKAAKGANAHQENRNVLLSNDATVNTKPHLEIDADDVRCTHGATVGRLDDNQRFYLRARGIDDEAARAILTYAFAVEMLERISVESERKRLAGLVLERMGRGELVKELT